MATVVQIYIQIMFVLPIVGGIFLTKHMDQEDVLEWLVFWYKKSTIFCQLWGNFRIPNS